MTGNTSDPTTDLGIVNDVIQKKVVPEAVTATVLNASTHIVPITCDIWIYTSSGMTAQDVQFAALARLGTYFAVAPIGGVVIPPAAGKVSWRALEANSRVSRLT